MISANYVSFATGVVPGFKKGEGLGGDCSSEIQPMHGWTKWVSRMPRKSTMLASVPYRFYASGSA